MVGVAFVDDATSKVSCKLQQDLVTAKVFDHEQFALYAIFDADQSCIYQNFPSDAH